MLGVFLAAYIIQTLTKKSNNSIEESKSNYFKQFPLNHKSNWIPCNDTYYHKWFEYFHQHFGIGNIAFF